MNRFTALLAIALPFLCVSSDGKARGQAFSGLPVTYVAKLAFESQPPTTTLIGWGERVDVSPGELSVLDATNPKPRTLLKGQGPVLSPNGAQVAFCMSDEEGTFHPWITNADGSEGVRPLVVRKNVCPSDWSPNGQELAVTDFDGREPMVAIINANGENFKTIAQGFDPQWSPDAKQILFCRAVKGKEGRTAIWTVKTDGTGGRKVVEKDTPPAPSISWNSMGPARFYDANRIVFSSDRSHNWCIFRVNLDGTGLEKVAENDKFDLFYPTFSPDGKQLVVQGDARAVGSVERPEKVILLFDVSGNRWTELAKGTSPSVLWGTKSPQHGEVILDRASAASNTSLITKGRERYLAYKCDECHGANGEGGGDGPDLIGTRLNADEISKFLEKPSPDAYMKGMPNIPKDHPDHQALVAYVLSLKRPTN